MSLLGTGDTTPTKDNFEGIERSLVTILLLLSCGALGIALAVASLVRKERPRWLSILALVVGALPFGVTFVIVAIIVLNT